MKKSISAGKTGLLLLAVFIISACTQIFSTSLAPWAARDPASLIPPVSTGNVDDLIATAETNPDLSLEVLKRIKDAVQNASPEEASELQAAALKAASNATGLGTTLLNAAGNMAGAMENPDNAKDLVVDALGGMQNLKDTSENLAAILPEPGTDEFDAFVEKASADDLAIAAAVLLAASASEALESGEYLNDFDSGAPASPQELLAVELAKAAAGKEGDTGLSGRLKDILDGLNLVG